VKNVLFYCSPYSLPFVVNSSAFPEVWDGDLSWLEATAKPDRIKRPSKPVKNIAIMNFLNIIDQLPPAAYVPSRLSFKAIE